MVEDIDRLLIALEVIAQGGDHREILDLLEKLDTSVGPEDLADTSRTP